MTFMEKQKLDTEQGYGELGIEKSILLWNFCGYSFPCETVKSYTRKGPLLKAVLEWSKPISSGKLPQYLFFKSWKFKAKLLSI